MRFYQALSVGRIPVLIDTKMTLPFENLIRWQDFIVFEKDEGQCLAKVQQIHAAGQILARQESCYRIFHDYLSPRVFLDQLLRQLQNGGAAAPRNVQ